MKRAAFSITLIFVFLSGKTQIIDFDYTPKNSCDTALITFTDMSLGIDTSNFSCSWNFDNGETYTANKYYKRNPPAQKYEHAGEYTVTYFVGSNFKMRTVVVSNSPNPFFQVLDTAGIPLTYRFVATNNFLPDSSYTWIIKKQDTILDTISGPRFNYTFLEEGRYGLRLIISDTSKAKCSSSYIKDVFAFPKLTVPSFMTPLNDGPHRFFTVPTNGNTVYRLSIYSRSGLIIYKSEGPRIWWDGYLLSGELAKAGTYFYIIETLSKPVNQDEKGFLLIIY